MFTSCTQTQGELRTLYYFMPAVIAVREVMLRKAPTSCSLQAHIDTHTHKNTQSSTSVNLKFGNTSLCFLLVVFANLWRHSGGTEKQLGSTS